MKTYHIALVGRPNVGKSTLFNRLVGRRVAIVHDMPGVTRDRREALLTFPEQDLLMIDTPGMEDPLNTPLKKEMWKQSIVAIETAELAVVVVDGREGITLADQAMARAIRKINTPCLIVVNKCEGQGHEASYAEAFKLGLGEPILISAEHGDGIGELWAEIWKHVQAFQMQESSQDCEGEAADARQEDEKEGPLKEVRLAIVGRPNAGKSTLVNRLIGEERLLTGDQPGTTRDAIDISWEFEGTKIILTDTAGMRKRAKVTDALERLAVKDSLRAIQFAHVVVLLVDAQSPLDKQDLMIARQVMNEGRCLVIGVNKWDLVTEQTAVLKELSYIVEKDLGYIRGVPLVPLSAKTGYHFRDLMRKVVHITEAWNKRLPTAALNRWLQQAVAQHPPPLVQQRPVKVKYVTQIKQRPPTFTLFVNRAGVLPDSYQRYLENSLRQAFNLPGIPLRFIMKAGDNPYEKKR